jgi:hypothetical protein
MQNKLLIVLFSVCLAFLACENGTNEDTGINSPTEPADTVKKTIDPRLVGKWYRYGDAPEGGRYRTFTSDNYTIFSGGEVVLDLPAYTLDGQILSTGENKVLTSSYEIMSEDYYQELIDRGGFGDSLIYKWERLKLAARAGNACHFVNYIAFDSAIDWYRGELPELPE